MTTKQQRQYGEIEGFHRRVEEGFKTSLETHPPSTLYSAVVYNGVVTTIARLWLAGKIEPKFEKRGEREFYLAVIKGQHVGWPMPRAEYFKLLAGKVEAIGYESNTEETDYDADQD